MANTYRVRLISLKKENLENLQNAIVEVNWTIVAEDDDSNSAAYDNKTTFDLNSVDSQNFILYEDLTEEAVVNWVKDVIGFETDNAHWLSIKNMVDTELERRYNQKRMVYSHQFPWAPEVELPSGSIS